jgi:hypothetical protein
VWNRNWLCDGDQGKGMVEPVPGRIDAAALSDVALSGLWVVLVELPRPALRLSLG